MKVERTKKAVVALLVVLAACGWGHAVDSNVPIGHWEFDEGTGPTAYDSAGSYDGTIYGAAWTTGRIGGALDFDGDDGVYLETSAGEGSPLNIYNTDLTIAAWAKIRGEGGSIVARSKGLYVTYKLGTIAGVSAYSAHINTYKQGPGHWGLHTDEMLDPDIWYHLVGVFDRSAGTGYVYVNGAEEAQGALGATPLSNDASTKIGCRQNTGDQAFDGSIDDVRIYDAALSPTEIEQLYEEVAGGPLSHWKFDEGSGTTAYDSAGDNDGNIYGATWTTGQIGGALDFNGVDDYVDVDDDSAFGFSQYDSFSISFWTKPQTNGMAVSKMRGSEQWDVFGYHVGWNASNSRFSFGIDRSRQYVTYVRTADACAPAASWYHVTAVYDNRDMKIYLNAELHESGTFGGGTGSTTPDKDLAIGARSYDWTMTSYYDGVIDDMRIYDRALLPEEVEQVYQEGVPDMNEVEGDYYVDGVNG
ncbi:MAG: LamG domain-containing protein, partial [Planctomycetota bacterium]